MLLFNKPDAHTASESAAALQAETDEMADQAILDQALSSPAAFQQKTEEAPEGAAPIPLSVPTERPQQLSEVEKPQVLKQVKEPVAAEDLYFWEDFQSLRKDEIKNPDSKENREGVVALMKARQRRVEQE